MEGVSICLGKLAFIFNFQTRFNENYHSEDTTILFLIILDYLLIP